MKRCLITLMLAALLCAVAPAQQQLESSIAQQAEQLSRLVDAPDNLPLRFRLLGHHADNLSDKETFDHWLGFFSDTRVLFWSSPTSLQAQNQMAGFEQDVAALANRRGVHLDLPPVGESPRADLGRGPVPAQVVRYTREGLRASTLQAERLATELLAVQPSQPLRELQTSLTRTRQALTSEGDAQAQAALRQVMASRAQLLLDSQNQRGETFLRLETQLNQLITAARQLLM